MLKKITTLFILGTLFANTLVWAAPSEPVQAGSSAELTLVESFIVLQGQHLTAKDTEQQSQRILSQYRQVAKPDGQIERFQQALVDLGVYTSAQANAFMTDATAAAAGLMAQGVNETTTLATFQNLTTLHPGGAQYSVCVAMIPVFLVGAVTALCLLNVNETAAEVFGLTALAAGFLGFVFQETEGC